MYPTPEFLRSLARPAPVLLWRVGLVMAACTLLLDLTLPGPAPASAALVVPLILSVGARSFLLTARLTALALAVSLLGCLGLLWQGGLRPELLGGRMLVAAVVLTVGVICSWLVRLPEARGAARLPENRALEGTGIAPRDLVERAGALLAHLSGASNFSVQRVESVEKAVRRETLEPAARRSWWLPAPPAPEPGPPVVWTTAQGQVLARLIHPEQGELLVRLDGPQAPLHFIADAVRVLQMQVERAAVLSEVNTQRELLRDLVYAFSHDLRTPITASMLNTQAALGGAFGPLPAAYLEVLRSGLDANRGLLSISDQMMLLAEYESGGPEGERAPIPLDAVIRDVVADVTLRARDRGLVLEAVLEPLWVFGYRYDLRRAVQNLLDNAVKFGPEGQPVRVRLYRADALARVEVTDAGPGVSPSMEPRLFQRFRTSAQSGGTGVGLYLTRRIAERHGGFIGYERRTAPPQSVFILQLPLVERPETPA
ncbi:sensor histidine kinase [Deinococcus sp. UYEF24]